MRTEIAHKEQLAICLWHMSGEPNNCCRQPIPRFVKAEGKSYAERWQHREDQFKAMRDQIEDLTTQISNLCGHKVIGSRNPIVECQTHGSQHLAQAHANWRVSRFKLNIPEFQRDLQPKEFLD